MKTKQTRIPKPSSGRPRSESSRLSILAAAYSLLEKSPVAAVSTLDIARRASVSTATIYRWWPNKESLLLDAFLHRSGHEAILRAGGSPLERLREYVLQVGRSLTGQNGIVAVRLLTAIQDSAALRREFLRRVYSPHEREVEETVREAIRQGQLLAGTEVHAFLETIFGPLFLRLLLRRERIDEAYVTGLFNRVVAGTRPAARPAVRRR